MNAYEFGNGVKPFNARPNRNGNDKQTVVHTYAKMRMAVTALMDTLVEVRAVNFHGRDYQLSGDPETARDADVAVILKVAELIGDLSNRALATQIELLGE
jgi:hypothetical protein